MKSYYIPAIVTTLVVATVLFSGHTQNDDADLAGKPTAPTLEDTITTLYTKYGEYVQVTEDGRILVKDAEVAETTLTSKLPAGTKIDVYAGPQGNGYQIIQETATATISTGYGGEAESRTFIIVKPVVTASTTP